MDIERKKWYDMLRTFMLIKVLTYLHSNADYKRFDQHCPLHICQDSFFLKNQFITIVDFRVFSENLPISPTPSTNRQPKK